VMFILAAGLLVRALAGPAQSLLVVAGLQNLAAMVLAATVAINAGLCLLLIPPFGIKGAAIATAVAFAFEALATLVIAQSYFGQQKHVVAR
jgi:O-antigen/teichoic acid export membrane protein